MAVNTTVDNAVIDYTAIASLLQTVKSHDDLFVQFSSGSMGNIATETPNNTTAGASAGTPIPASSFLAQGVQYQGVLSGASATTVTVYWGQPFGGAPVIVATPYISGATSAKPSVYIQSINDTTGATFVITNADTASASASFTLNVLALGTRAA